MFINSAISSQRGLQLAVQVIKSIWQLIPQNLYFSISSLKVSPPVMGLFQFYGAMSSATESRQCGNAVKFLTRTFPRVLKNSVFTCHFRCSLSSLPIGYRPVVQWLEPTPPSWYALRFHSVGHSYQRQS